MALGFDFKPCGLATFTHWLCLSDNNRNSDKHVLSLVLAVRNPLSCNVWYRCFISSEQTKKTPIILNWCPPISYLKHSKYFICIHYLCLVLVFLSVSVYNIDTNKKVILDARLQLIVLKVVTVLVDDCRHQLKPFKLNWRSI